VGECRNPPSAPTETPPQLTDTTPCPAFRPPPMHSRSRRAGKPQFRRLSTRKALQDVQTQVQRPPSRELLNGRRFDSLLKARVIIKDWRRDYNANRPHSAHGELTPTEFALQWTTTHQPQVHSDWTTNRVPLRPPRGRLRCRSCGRASGVHDRSSTLARPMMTPNWRR